MLGPSTNSQIPAWIGLNKRKMLQLHIKLWIMLLFDSITLQKYWVFKMRIEETHCSTRHLPHCSLCSLWKHVRKNKTGSNLYRKFLERESYSPTEESNGSSKKNILNNTTNLLFKHIIIFKHILKPAMLQHLQPTKSWASQYMNRPSGLNMHRHMLVWVQNYVE